MIDSEASDGPAITVVEYRIDSRTAVEFLEAMKELKRIRLRDGAIRWNLSRDTADPQRYVETFVAESWADHLRQHERVTAADRAVEERVEAFHLGPDPPKTTHLVGEELSS
ncbi:MAG TPA: MFS transporter, partial [Pyrinomonadaceae bacterium]|nr:MFS transporter [Pyrinomonadaceae bacterium]